MKPGMRREATGNKPKVNVFCATLCALLFALSFLGALLYALCFPAEAQQPAKTFRVGFLTYGSPPPNVDHFVKGLQELGYIEGKNIALEYRSAQGKNELLPELTRELIALRSDVIVTTSAMAARGAKQATTTTPIVMVGAGDPIGTGLIASLARPGGNVTGLTNITAELAGKRLDLLKEALPKAKLVAVLHDTTASGAPRVLEDVQVTAQTLGVKIQSLGVRPPEPDFEGAFQKARKERVDGLIAAQSPLLSLHRKQILELANKSRLPTIYPNSLWTDEGGLMSYGVNSGDLLRRAAIYVDKILKGAKPADLPVEQPTKFELVINLKTAKQIGLTIPPSILARADKIIR